jgi:putative PIN family toxin of toxin-antitoxin system
MRAVLDTSVLVAAIRSSRGASRELLRKVLDEEFKPLVSVPLVLEYEEVLTRSEHLIASVFDKMTVLGIVKTFCTLGEPVHIAHRLRPQLVDPDDEFVLEAAYHGKAEAIVTLNTRDFLIAARRFGISALLPGEALERMKRR